LTSGILHIAALLKKDILLEIRQQYTFYGILLYVASTIFVLYLAVAKSFLQENSGRMLYYYSIAGARQFIISKLIFNAVLMIIMSITSLLLFRLLMGDPLTHPWKFLMTVCLGGTSLSLVFTFLAAIAARARQNAALIAIMGFPLIIPQILLLMRVSNTAFADVLQGGYGQMSLLLAGLDVLVIALALILFPFLWKD
jgi:heme exporter protein B